MTDPEVQLIAELARGWKRAHRWLKRQFHVCRFDICMSDEWNLAQGNCGADYCEFYARALFEEWQQRQIDRGVDISDGLLIDGEADA